MILFEQLPEEIMVHILSMFEDSVFEEILLITLPCVCRAWFRLFGNCVQNNNNNNNNSNIYVNIQQQQQQRFWMLLGNNRNHDNHNNYCNNEMTTTNISISSRSSNNNKRRRLLRRNTPSTIHPKIAFFLRYFQLKRVHKNEIDQILLQIMERLQKNDCVSHVQKQIQKLVILCRKRKQLRTTADTTTKITAGRDNGDDNDEVNNIILHHRVSSQEHRILLHHACWWGRIKTVKLLFTIQRDYTTNHRRRRQHQHQNQCYSYHKQDYNSVFSTTTTDTPTPTIWDMVDDSDASPLLVSAWAGHTNIVRVILAELSLSLSQTQLHRRQFYLDRSGMPPLTSSCGGKGKKSAVCWAQRKGFQTVVQLLKKAGATTTNTTNINGR